MPQGWQIDEDGNMTQHADPKHHDHHDHYIKLKHNLYGCKQAAHNWFLHLSSSLQKEGFQQSACDPCLFLRKDCIIIIYTDDCIVFAKEDSSIDKFLPNNRIVSY